MYQNKLVTMARELLVIEDDLHYRLEYYNDRRAAISDFDVHTFEQTWGSTALGFEGIGGQAMTTSNTYVIVPKVIDHPCVVYFSGRFAYKCPYTDTLKEDIKNHSIAPIWEMSRYKKQEES